jgi:hypothetical protein
LRAVLEQVVAREAENEDRDAHRRGEQVVDQVEEGRLRPVDVLEHEDERAS